MATDPLDNPESDAAQRVHFKTALRRVRRKARERQGEIKELNITAMMDMMTIILVFLLKCMSSSTSPPQSSDLMMPKSVVTTEAAQEGLAILVSKSHIVVDDNPVCPVPPDATHGVEGKYKRSGGTNDLYVVPLANAAQSWRDKDIMIRAAMGKDTTSSEAILVGDADMPFRLLTEVLFTLGQTSFAKFHLMVMQGKKG